MRYAELAGTGEIGVGDGDESAAAASITRYCHLFGKRVAVSPTQKRIIIVPADMDLCRVGQRRQWHPATKVYHRTRVLSVTLEARMIFPRRRELPVGLRKRASLASRPCLVAECSICHAAQLPDVASPYLKVISHFQPLPCRFPSHSVPSGSLAIARTIKPPQRPSSILSK